MPKFVVNLDTTMSVSGMRFVPIMLEEQGMRVPLVLVRKNAEEPEFTLKIVTHMLDMLNAMLDPTVPFSDLEKPKDGELVWHDEGEYIRAAHPYATNASFYVRHAPGGQYVASLVDGVTKDIRSLGMSATAQKCFEMCEDQLQRYKATM